MAPDYLLFARQGALWARTMDREWTGVVGGFIPIAPKVLVSPDASGLGAVSASSVGSLAYRESGPTRQLMWVDRSGRTVATVGQPDNANLSLKELSNDGRTIAVLRTIDGNPDVWLVDAERGVSRRLTFDPGDDGEAVFSPDGSRVAYVSDGRDDVYQMYERRADGTGSQTLLFDSGENKNLTDWSPDGRYILYVSQSSTTNLDLWALPLTGDRTPVEVVRTPFAEMRGTFSPDGRWIAYSSNESGRFEVSLRPFPGPGPAMQVSVGGGNSPRWARNGRELFYLAPDNRLMAVPVEPRGSALAAGSPRALFMLSSPSYDPSPDGERFLVTATVAEASPITVILNWKPPGE